MDLFTTLYVSMILILSICIVLIVNEASRLHWSKLAKWLTLRMCGVYGIIIMMIVAVILFSNENDLFMQGIMLLALLSMFVLLVLHLPEILRNMSDEELAEDLNVKEYNHPDDAPTIK